MAMYPISELPSDLSAMPTSSDVTVVAIRYMAVQVVTAPDGASVYSFVFHLKTSNGAVYALGSRYSLLRRLAQLLEADQPAAAANLPPFPRKYSMSSQTPQFLLSRGRALEAFLSAVLGEPRLSAVPAVRELLRAAELHKAPPAAAAEPPSQPQTPSAAIVQQQQQTPPPPSPRSSTGLFRPFASLVLALIAGTYFNQYLLCVVSTLLGLGAGKAVMLIRGSREPEDAAAAVVDTFPVARNYPNANAAAASSSLSSKKPMNGAPRPNGHHAATTTAAPPVAIGVEVAPPISTLEQHAGREAVIALEMLTQCIEAAKAGGGGGGWAFLKRSDDVDVFINRRPDGPTWGMGAGIIHADPRQIHRVCDSDEYMPVLDKQHLKTDVIKVLPHAACKLPDGWVVETLQLQQNLYKSPAWPVGPRETCTVRLTARRPADGAVRQVQRSVNVPGVNTPSGYVRATLGCGGYEACPTGNRVSTAFTYVNILDPNGHIPQFVVNTLVPDRALQVARVRKCVMR